MHPVVKPLLMSIKFFLLTLFACCICYPLSAQTPADAPLEISSCSISVQANMFTATTVMQLELYNPNQKILDGEYDFSLQAAQVVTGFALDINGLMREGVIVDKQQGRVAYENTIRRRIDPGLLEMTAGNHYRVRVYPMPAKGIRKIRITISQLLTATSGSLLYDLPLGISYAIKNLQLTCAVKDAVQSPSVMDGLLKGKSFEKSSNGYHLSFSEKNAMLKQRLLFEIPFLQNKAVLYVDHNKPQPQFFLRIKAGDTISEDSIVNSTTIFWDVSASARKRDVKKELAFLQAFAISRKLSELNLVIFSNAVQQQKKFILKNGGLQSALRLMEAQAFDGGTALGIIDCKQYNTDLFMLFSDGLSNVGNDALKLNGKPLYCINSAAAADLSLLKKIATTSGAAYVDLSVMPVDAALASLKSAPLQLLSVKQDGKELPLNTALPLSSNNWFTIMGRMYNTSSDIILDFGKEGRLVRTEKLSILTQDIRDNISMDTSSMLQQYESLQNNDAEDENAIAFARQHRFVNAALSFIVLDNVEDYIQYGIVPPADLQPQYQQKLSAVKKLEEDLKASKATEETDNLKKAAALYNDRIRWWSADAPLINVDVLELKPVPPAFSGSQDANSNTNNVVAINGLQLNSNTVNSLSEVVVIGYGSRKRRDLTGSVVSISSADIASSGAQSVAQALQGRVAGVSITQNGIPGAAEQILIRGTSSLQNGKEPLYILDGLPVESSDIRFINVQNIESITVFKGVEAAVLYGSRGANGVIVITTKRGTVNRYQPPPALTKYSDLEDMDYIDELREIAKPKMYEYYLSMKDSFENDAAFYFDVAQLLFENGDQDHALRVLTNLAEIRSEDHQLLRAMGYQLESWKLYEQAIEVYKKVLAIKEEEPQSYRDLALAYERNGQHRQAVEILYRVITKNFYQYEARYRGLKSLLLNEMTAIVSQYPCTEDRPAINENIIRPLPADIRIVVDWNKDETDLDLHVVEPGGEECFFGNKFTATGGRLSDDFTQGYGPEEYEIQSAKKGRYAVIINYYGDRYQKQQTPSFVKLTIYRNFGKPDQSVQVQTFLMNNQRGKIEIASIKF